VFEEIHLPRFLQKNLSGISSSVSLGLLLALPAFIGHLIGTSFDVRHVTLGAGSVVFALFSLWKQNEISNIFTFVPLYFSVAGVLLVGLLNVFVSFSLALLLALKSLNMKSSVLFKLMARVLLYLIKHPIKFFQLE
jgi:site-specific recombinase